MQGNLFDVYDAAGWNTAFLSTSFLVAKKVTETNKFRIRAQRTTGSSTLVTTASASNFIGQIYS